MKMEFDIQGEQAIARQIGPADWQDVHAACADSALVLEENPQVSQFLIDLTEGSVRFPSSDAQSLAEVFSLLAPPSITVAMVKPADGSGAEKLEAFAAAAREKGFRFAVFDTLDEATAFLRGGKSESSASGPLAGGLPNMWRRAARMIFAAAGVRNA